MLVKAAGVVNIDDNKSAQMVGACLCMLCWLIAHACQQHKADKPVLYSCKCKLAASSVKQCSQIGMNVTAQSATRFTGFREHTYFPNFIPEL